MNNIKYDLNRMDMKKSKKTNKLLVSLCFALGLSGTSLLSSQYLFAAPRVVEQVAAVVNNNVILESDVKEMMISIKANTDPANLPDNTILRSQILDRLITENLILQEAQRLKITVTDDEVTDTIRNIAKENGATIDELRKYLLDTGISYSSYRERIHNEMLLDEARMASVSNRVNVTEKEVEALANTIAKQPTANIDINISHILIEIPENPTKAQVEQATNKAKEVISRLQNNESFAKLAATYSNDVNALKGGNMGWHRLNELPTIFEERLIRAQKGEIIGPLRSGVGYHILKVEDTRAEQQKAITVKEVNARHILIKTNVLVTDDMAQDKLNSLRQGITIGAISFEEAAKSNSEDPGSAENGGELGWNLPERYDRDFANALLKLKKGEISKPIKSSFGWHLIQLHDTRNVDKTDLAKKEQAYRLIFNRKFTEELQVWIQELKGDAYIKIIETEKN